MPGFISNDEVVEIVLRDDNTLILKTGDTLRELMQTHVQKIVAKPREKGLDVLWSLITAGGGLLLLRLPFWAAIVFLVAVIAVAFDSPAVPTVGETGTGV